MLLFTAVQSVQYNVDYCYLEEYSIYTTRVMCRGESTKYLLWMQDIGPENYVNKCHAYKLYVVFDVHVGDLRYIAFQ
jgi:hypothetical protein